MKIETLEIHDWGVFVETEDKAIAYVGCTPIEILESLEAELQ